MFISFSVCLLPLILLCIMVCCCFRVFDMDQQRFGEQNWEILVLLGLHKRGVC